MTKIEQEIVNLNIDKKSLLNIFFEFVLLQFEINDEESNLKVKDNYISLLLANTKNNNCPTTFIIYPIGNTYKIEILFNSTGPIIEDYIENTTESLIFLKSIKETFQNEIIENKIYVNKLNLKTKYTYYDSFLKRISYYEGGNIGVFYIFKKKNIIEHKFKAWF